jgi:hypothetical protein
LNKIQNVPALHKPQNYEWNVYHETPWHFINGLHILSFEQRNFPWRGADIGNRFAWCHKDDAKVVLAISPAAFDGMWTVMRIVIQTLPFHTLLRVIAEHNHKTPRTGPATLHVGLDRDHPSLVEYHWTRALYTAQNGVITNAREPFGIFASMGTNVAYNEGMWTRRPPAWFSLLFRGRILTMSRLLYTHLWMTTTWIAARYGT